MATEIFTTWAALRDKLKDIIQASADSGELRTKSVTDPDGVTRSYQSLSEMLRDLRKIESLAANEADTQSRQHYGPIALRATRV